MFRNVVVACALIATAFALQGQFSNLVIQNCNSSDCSSGCTNFTVPLRQCEGGQSFSCHTSTSQCAYMTRFAANDTDCGSAAAAASLPLICDYCMTISNNDQNVTHGQLTGCGQDTLTWNYDCDATCVSCKHKVSIPKDQCVLNPMDDLHYKVNRVGACGDVVGFREYNNSQCDGRSQYFLNVANQCYPNGNTNDQGGSKFSCV